MKIKRILEIICASLLALMALYGVYTATALLFFQAPIGYGENTIMVSAWGLLNGHGLYRISEMNRLPAFFAQYTPVSYLLVALGFKLFGLSYFFGRLISLASILGSAAFIGLTARRLSSNRFGAVIGSLVFLSAWPVMIFSRQLRSDNISVFFEMAALYLILDDRRKWKSWAAIAFALLAGYTKQTAFGVFVGALAGLYLDGNSARKKQIMAISAVYVISAALIFVALQLTTGGGFYLSALSNHLGNFESNVFFTNIASTFKDPLDLIVVLAGIYSAVAYYYRKGSKLLLCLLPIPLALALSAASKTGAGTNYFIEPFAALSVAFALIFRSAPEQQTSRKTNFETALKLAIIVSVFASLPIRHDTLKTWFHYWQKRDQYTGAQTTVKSIRKFIKPGSLILTEYSQIPLFGDCVPALSDPFKFTEMSRNGLWNPAPLVNALKNKNLALVLIQEKLSVDTPMQFIPKEAAQAILDNYSPVNTGAEDVYAYFPKTNAAH